jgi:hypothetical protein
MASNIGTWTLRVRDACRFLVVLPLRRHHHWQALRDLDDRLPNDLGISREEANRGCRLPPHE